ncbi:SDR family oxidoreductase [bacterium]|nr:SDR family oxidoreductase [bacterium]
MRVLVAGANGYVGSRLCYKLAEKGYHVIALVRNKDRFNVQEKVHDKIEVLECDLLQKASLNIMEGEIDCAFYLVHSLSAKQKKFYDLEEKSAIYFRERMEELETKKIVYLSGLSGENPKSEHMRSRDRVGQILLEGKIPVVNFQAGIIIGSGSASFELMRDLVEKLPVMIAPRWVSSKCQPIGISDVLYYLEHIVDKEVKESVIYHIGGPDVLTYKEMLYCFAKIRGLKRWILSVPVLTPHLSSLWLYFITSTNMYLAKRLVHSLAGDAVCLERGIEKVLPHKCLDYAQTIERAFDKIEQNHVFSSWKDALNKVGSLPHFDVYIHAPEHGCLTNVQTRYYTTPKEKILDKLWSIGGKNGWYYMTWAWKIRGRIDKLFGGVGLRRGRRSPTELQNGEALDFWRVIKSDRANGELLLFAEMKVPGEAWLSWKVREEENKVEIHQVATFRPKGVLGRLYWYSLWPVHIFIFRGLCNQIGKGV